MRVILGGRPSAALDNHIYQEDLCRPGGAATGTICAP